MSFSSATSFGEQLIFVVLRTLRGRTGRTLFVRRFPSWSLVRGWARKRYHARLRQGNFGGRVRGGDDRFRVVTYSVVFLLWALLLYLILPPMITGTQFWRAGGNSFFVVGRRPNTYSDNDYVVPSGTIVSTKQNLTIRGGGPASSGQHRGLLLFIACWSIHKCVPAFPVRFGTRLHRFGTRLQVASPFPKFTRFRSSIFFLVATTVRTNQDRTGWAEFRSEIRSRSRADAAAQLVAGGQF